MAEAWYEGLPEDAFKTDTVKAYERALVKIKAGLARGLDFDHACAEIEVKDEELRKVIIDDVLKVFIAEEHFAKDVPLGDLARNLKVPVDRLESAKASMLEEIREESIKAFYKGLGGGNA